MQYICKDTKKAKKRNALQHYFTTFANKTIKMDFASPYDTKNPNVRFGIINNVV